jgi:hypothetical protein
VTLPRLSLVTQTLQEVIRRSVLVSPEWPGGGTVLTVSPEPPDKLTGDHTIGLYLYHVAEDGPRRNAPVPGDAALESRYAPLPLVAHYLLTAHSDLVSEQAPIEEQFLMGLGMKALRDFSCIDDDTRVGAAQVMAPGARERGNRFLVTPRTVGPGDAVSYWTAGQHALRLTAYYEVASVLLDPDPAPSRTRRVFALGLRVVSGGGPHLSGSRSEHTFTVPGDPTPRTVVLQPAEVTIGQAFELVGSDLAGNETRLLLQHSSWPEPVAADPPAWGVVAQQHRVLAKAAAFVGPQPLLPGVYSASVVVVTRTGAGPEVTARSNVSPFTVAPAVTGISTPTALGRFTVTGGRFDPDVLLDDDIEVFLGADRLVRRAAGATDPGEFRVDDAEHLEARFPAGTAPGDIVPVRIIVRGAESPPRWVSAP